MSTRKAAGASPGKRATTRPAASTRSGLNGEELLARLAEAARIGALFIEGEDCIEALVPESRDWTKADDINYNGQIGAALKKTLLRIEQIDPSLHAVATLWRRRPDDAERVEVILGGRVLSPMDQGKGKCPPIFPALRSVFDKARSARQAVAQPAFERAVSYRCGSVPLRKNDRLLAGPKRSVSYFLPIRDSREQVVAALELSCVVRPADQPDPRPRIQQKQS